MKTLFVTATLMASATMFASFARAEERLSREAFRALHMQLREKMGDDISVAVDFLEKKIEASPDSGDLQIFREILAAKLSKERRNDDAIRQVTKLLEFQIEHASVQENQFGIPLTIKALKSFVEKSGRFYSTRKDTYSKLIDRAYSALHDHSQKPEFGAHLPLAQLAVEKSRFLVANKKVDEAKELLADHSASLRKLAESDTDGENASQALIRMLRTITTDDAQNDPWRDDYVKELTEFVQQAVTRFPESFPIQNDYAETQYLLITRWGQDDPEETKKQIETTRKNLTAFALDNQSVNAILRRIDLHAEKLKSAKPKSSLVGKPAPKWDIDAWVNADEATQDSFKGKVVLLDFWAMWCGPCIATFPHLKEWREEFGDKDFEIIGVTQYYGMEWDAENKRARRSQEDVSGWNERSTIMSFLEHYKLEHPVFVTPKESDMQSDYGVRGIPHAVLIDREGVVQLIQVGAGKEAADAIHAKIKELVDAKP